MIFTQSTTVQKLEKFGRRITRSSDQLDAVKIPRVSVEFKVVGCRGRQEAQNRLDKPFERAIACRLWQNRSNRQDEWDKLHTPPEAERANLLEAKIKLRQSKGLERAAFVPGGYYG